MLKARQTKYAAYAIVYILVVVAIVVVANVLADRYNKTYDGTANKRYSLSDQTAKIAKGLKQDATITYFNQSTRFQQGKDLLDQYTNLSPKVHVKYVDPDKEPQIAREAGIKNYGTAIVQIGAKKEEAKGLTEEGITGAFIRTLKGKTRMVCFVSGSGEHQIDDSGRNGYSHFKELLSKDEYESKSINLLQKAEIPADCTVLVVAGPTGDYQQTQVDALKKFVEDGGRAFFMLDAPLKMGRSEIADNEAWTKQRQIWGVTGKKDPVVIAPGGSYNTGKANVQGRFVVLGSSGWAANSFLPFNGHRDLALTAMNWLSSDEDLISIRPKEQDDRRITMTESQFSWV